MSLTLLDVDPAAQVPSFVGSVLCDTASGKGLHLTQDSYNRSPRWVALSSSADWWYSNLDGADPDTAMIHVLPGILQPIQLSPGGSLDLYIKTKTGTATVMVFTADKSSGGTSTGSGAVQVNVVTSTATLKNNGGAPVTIGQVVYTDATGSFQLAQDNSTLAKATAVGMVQDASIAAGALGSVVLYGAVTGLSGLTPGLQTFLSPTPGGTITAPETTPGSYSVPIGAPISTTVFNFQPQPPQLI